MIGIDSEVVHIPQINLNDLLLLDADMYSSFALMCLIRSTPYQSARLSTIQHTV